MIVKNVFLTSFVCRFINRVTIVSIWSNNLRPIFSSYVCCPHSDTVFSKASKVIETFLIRGHISDVFLFAGFLGDGAIVVEFLRLESQCTILYNESVRFQLGMFLCYIPSHVNSGVAFSRCVNVQDNVRS